MHPLRVQRNRLVSLPSMQPSRAIRGHSVQPAPRRSTPQQGPGLREAWFSRSTPRPVGPIIHPPMGRPHSGARCWRWLVAHAVAWSRTRRYSRLGGCPLARSLLLQINPIAFMSTWCNWRMFPCVHKNKFACSPVLYLSSLPVAMEWRQVLLFSAAWWRRPGIA